IYGVYGPQINLTGNASADITVSNAGKSRTTATSADPWITGAYYVAAEYAAGQGSSVNPFVMNEVRVPVNVTEINSSNIHTSASTAVTLYAAGNTTNSVDSISLTTGEADVTFYAVTEADAWYKITVKCHIFDLTSSGDNTGLFFEVNGATASGAQVGDEVIVNVSDVANFRKLSANNDEIEITEIEANAKYKFTMPGKNVNVNVTAGYHDIVYIGNDNIYLTNGALKATGGNVIPGLSWSYFTNTLTLENYDGSDIRKDTLNNLKIELIGENKITAFNRSALDFNSLEITGTNKNTDKLVVVVNNNDHCPNPLNAITSSEKLDIENATLDVKFNVSITASVTGSKSFWGIYSPNVGVDGGELKISLDRSDTDINAKRMHLFGLSGDLELTNGATAKIDVYTHAGWGDTAQSNKQTDLVRLSISSTQPQVFLENQGMKRYYTSYRVTACYTSAQDGTKDNPYELDLYINNRFFTGTEYITWDTLFAKEVTSGEGEGYLGKWFYDPIQNIYTNSKSLTSNGVTELHVLTKSEVWFKLKVHSRSN
ncbi:MAG: hypothetical protein GX834_05780, partial [Clostridiaceae bacterium]|nr:hypothetical protein [Clostridiaceae bacterium]